MNQHIAGRQLQFAVMPMRVVDANQLNLTGGARYRPLYVEEVGTPSALVISSFSKPHDSAPFVCTAHMIPIVLALADDPALGVGEIT